MLLYIPLTLAGLATLILYSSRAHHNKLYQIILTITVFSAIFIPLTHFLEVTTFNEFEIQYSLREKLYEEANNKNDVSLILNMSEVNEKLVAYQARYLKWGDWCFVPKKVMNMKPIGINQGVLNTLVFYIY